MNKKIIAIILEMIPIISAVISFIFIMLPYGSKVLSFIIPITVLLAFLGFVFFFTGRKLCKEDKLVKVLGIMDWLATGSIIFLYIIAIFAFGL